METVVITTLGLLAFAAFYFGIFGKRAKAKPERRRTDKNASAPQSAKPRTRSLSGVRQMRVDLPAYSPHLLDLHPPVEPPPNNVRYLREVEAEHQRPEGFFPRAAIAKVGEPAARQALHQALQQERDKRMMTFPVLLRSSPNVNGDAFPEEHPYTSHRNKEATRDFGGVESAAPFNELAAGVSPSPVGAITQLQPELSNESFSLLEAFRDGGGESKPHFNHDCCCCSDHHD